MDSQIEVVTDAQMWSLIVGFLSPLLIAVVMQPKWPNLFRVVVTVVWSVVAGAGTAFFAGEFSGRGVISAALVVCVTAIATYSNLWKPSRIAPLIEAKTSGGAHVVTTVSHSPSAVDNTAPRPPQ